MEYQIEKIGVLTFNKGISLGKTSEYSCAAELTKKLSTRGLYLSKEYRLWASIENALRNTQLLAEIYRE